MALIGRIRKNFWFVLILLGLALAAFVIMDAVSANNRGGLGAKQVVGSVAGTEIDIQDFQRVESTLYGGSSDQYVAKSATWNYFVEKAIVDQESERIGLGVSGDELYELQFGPNYSPIIQQNFRDQQSGQFNEQQVLSIKQQIESGEQLPPQFVAFWKEQQNMIVKTAKEAKINNLVGKALFAPTFMVQSEASKKSNRVTFDYVRVPFDYIDDAEIEVTEDAIADYLQEHKHSYNNDSETRTLKYITVNVAPTPEDSLEISEELSNSLREFKQTEDDSIFAINNEGFMSPVYTPADELAEALQANIADLEIGDTYGPYIANERYTAVKLLDKKVIPDSVEARHILVSTQQGMSESAARAKADSIRNVFVSGTSSFDSLAIKHSDDPGSATSGGELGYFTQGRMVKPFNDAVFLDSEEGGIYTVKTQFGIHIIEVTDLIFTDDAPKYKLAYISSAIVPSQETQDELYEEMTTIVSENRDLASLQQFVDNNPSYSLEISSPLKENDYMFGNLGSGQTSREIVQWAYTADKGTVSPTVYRYTDPVHYYDNKYVIVALDEIVPAGLPSASSMRSTIEPLVANEMKAEKIMEQMDGSDLTAMASKFGTTVERVEDAFIGKNIPSLGNEPKVVYQAISTEINKVSSPIKGNSGIYLVKPIAHNEVPSAASIPQQRQTLQQSTRSNVKFSLWDALKKNNKPEDNRAKYF